MSTLYRPVLIETAEQAEALPEGTVATHGGTDGYCYEVAIRDQDGEWWSAPGGLGQEEPAYADDTIVGFTALVPIEAEEETVACGDDWSIPTHEGLMPNGDVVPNGWSVHTRFVTPWEEV